MSTMEHAQNSNVHESVPSPLPLCLLLLSLFMLVFAITLRRDAGKIANHDLLRWDESTNSVVSANLARRLFPAMLRLNSLVDKAYETYDPMPKDSWLFNAYWQHISPLFAYVPVPFFVVEGKATIETKRLAYALVSFITGCIFIIGVAFFSKELMAAITATIAAMLWIQAPFSRSLVTGKNFGTSDIVLAFTTTLCFVILLWYLRDTASQRTMQPRWRLIFYGIIFSLPLLVKHLLGVIPAVTFFTLFFYDQYCTKQDVRSFCLRFFFCIVPFLLLPLLYYGSLWLSSPETFSVEFSVAFKHMGNYEGLGRPWYYFLSYYLPRDYQIKPWMLVLVSGIILFLILKYKNLEKKQAVLLFLPAGLFFANLIMVSLVTSKTPNTMFQSYLFFIFIGLYSLVLLLPFPIFSRAALPVRKITHFLLIVMFAVTMLFATREFYLAQKEIYQKGNSSSLNTVHKRCYAFAECARDIGWGVGDLILLKTGYDDFWITYYFIFHTGAETRMYDNFLAIARKQGKEFFIKRLREKYLRIIFIINKNKIASMHLPVHAETAAQCSIFLPSTRIIYLEPQEYDTLL